MFGVIHYILDCKSDKNAFLPNLERNSTRPQVWANFSIVTTEADVPGKISTALSTAGTRMTTVPNAWPCFATPIQEVMKANSKECMVNN